MFHIAICDDERTEIKYLSSLVNRWAGQRSNIVRISDYDSAENFLFHLEDEQNIDILLLDIQMKKMDGVQLAHRIRKNNESMQIIFITGYPDFMAQGYDVSALHYLIKPVKEEKLFEVLDKAVLHLDKSSRIIRFPKTGGDIKIKADSIIYAEVLSHRVVLYLADGKKEDFSMRISDMQLLLGEGFFKCHRSYIVSMKHVTRVTKTAMVLDNSREIPLSRDLYDEANQEFIMYN